MSQLINENAKFCFNCSAKGVVSELIRYIFDISPLFSHIVCIFGIIIVSLILEKSILILLDIKFTEDKKKLNNKSPKSESRSEEIDIYHVIKNAKYQTAQIGNYKKQLIIKRETVWDPLSKSLIKNELKVHEFIPYDNFYIVRMNGIDFGSLIKKIGLDGIIDGKGGYSKIIEKVMIETAKSIVKFTSDCILAFTQGDEIVILVKPCKDSEKVFGKRRLTNYLSTISSRVSVIFNNTLIRNLIIDENKSALDIPLFAFFAQISIYDRYYDALKMLLWRSNSCEDNALMDIFKFANFNIPDYITLSKTQRLRTLTDIGLMNNTTNHQLYGTTIINDERETISECGSYFTGYQHTTLLSDHFTSLIKNKVIKFDEKDLTIEVN